MPGFCGVCGDLPSKLVWPISVGKELSPTIKKTAEFDEHYIRFGNVLFGNVLYREWIEGYIPIASKYPWEKTGVTINASLIRKIVARGIKIIRRDLFRDKTQISMNPFDYWYDSNPELREIFETYLKDHIHLLNKHPVLKEDTVLLFDGGNALEKTQALTLLAAVDLLQLDK